MAKPAFTKKNKKTYAEKREAVFASDLDALQVGEIVGYGETQGQPYVEVTNVFTNEDIRVFRNWPEDADFPNPLFGMRDAVEPGGVVFFKDLEPSNLMSGDGVNAFICKSFSTIAKNDNQEVDIVFDEPSFAAPPVEFFDDGVSIGEFQLYNVIDVENASRIDSIKDLAVRLKKYIETDFKREGDSILLRGFSEEENIAASVQVSINIDDTVRSLAISISEGPHFMSVTGARNEVVTISGPDLMDMLQDPSSVWEFIPVSGYPKRISYPDQTTNSSKLSEVAGLMSEDFIDELSGSDFRQGFRNGVLGVRHDIRGEKKFSDVTHFYYGQEEAMPLELVSTTLLPNLSYLKSYQPPAPVEAPVPDALVDFFDHEEQPSSIIRENTVRVGAKAEPVEEAPTPTIEEAVVVEDAEDLTFDLDAFEEDDLVSDLSETSPEEKGGFEDSDDFDISDVADLRVGEETETFTLPDFEDEEPEIAETDFEVEEADLNVEPFSDDEEFRLDALNAEVEFDTLSTEGTFIEDNPFGDEDEVELSDLDEPEVTPVAEIEADPFRDDEEFELDALDAEEDTPEATIADEMFGDDEEVSFDTLDAEETSVDDDPFGDEDEVDMEAFTQKPIARDTKGFEDLMSRSGARKAHTILDPDQIGVVELDLTPDDYEMPDREITASEERISFNEGFNNNPESAHIFINNLTSLASSDPDMEEEKSGFAAKM